MTRASIVPNVHPSYPGIHLWLVVGKVQEEGKALGYAAARVLGMHENNNHYKDCEVSSSLLTAALKLKVLVIMIGSEQSVVNSHCAMKVNRQ